MCVGTTSLEILGLQKWKFRLWSLEELTASIIRVAVKMEAARSTAMLVSAYRTSCYHKPGDHNLKIIPYKSL